MSHGVIHVRIEGITHEATQYESHGLLSLTCENRQFPPPGRVMYRKTGTGDDVGLAMPVDCMACLVRMVPR